MHNVEPSTDFDFVNYQTQRQANLLHQPATVAQTTSIMEPSLIEPISVPICSKQIHQTLSAALFVVIYILSRQKTCRSDQERDAQ